MDAVNLKNVTWNTPQGVARFPSNAGFGIQNEVGQLLSANGEDPASWRTKKVVVSMLPYAGSFPSYTWINVN